jgi:hypothetical protein
MNRYEENVESFLSALRKTIDKTQNWRFVPIRSNTKPLELIFKSQESIDDDRRKMTPDELADVAKMMEPLAKQHGVNISSRETDLGVTVYSVTIL